MNYRECAEWLKRRDGFTIVSHIRPDGDTLGSSAALCSALRRAGKTAYLFPNPEITEKYAKYVNKFISSDFSGENIIAVDVADERMFCIGFSQRVQLCIDHHPKNPHYADELLLNGEKASCGEIILEVIKELCGSVTEEEASLLYMAVSTDCGCFRYANVTSETFAAASELAAFGADVQGLNFKLFRQMSRARMTLEGLISSGLRFYKDGRVVVAEVTLDMLERSGAVEDDCDDIAGIPGKVEGCVVSMVIRQLEENKCKVSVRSQPSFDSSALCAVFGGGGHRMASGCTLEGKPDEVREKFMEALDKLWEEAE